MRHLLLYRHTEARQITKRTMVSRKKRGKSIMRITLNDNATVYDSGSIDLEDVGLDGVRLTMFGSRHGIKGSLLLSKRDLAEAVNKLNEFHSIPYGERR